jgi:hypothetical protein
MLTALTSWLMGIKNANSWPPNVPIFVVALDYVATLVAILSGLVADLALAAIIVKFAWRYVC